MIGIGVGLVAALAGGRLIETLLYNVNPRDPIVIGVVTLLLTAIALIACWLPARRAARLSPLEALTNGLTLSPRRAPRRVRGCQEEPRETLDYGAANAAIRSMTQNIATAPIEYAGTASAHRGHVFGIFVNRKNSPSTAATNTNCPISTPTLKNSSATGIARVWQADLRQRTGEAEPVHQTEAERDHPGPPRGESGLPAAGLYDFARHEDDAQRDAGLDWGLRRRGPNRAPPRSASDCASS